jgi:hypothetical protein
LGTFLVTGFGPGMGNDIFYETGRKSNLARQVLTPDLLFSKPAVGKQVM